MKRLERVLDIAKRRGFFWQSAMIHGSLAGFYDYGHIGTMLKRRFENLWRHYFLGLDDNFYEIETCSIMPESVFKSSGHLTHFVDPVVECKKCGNVERADHILEKELNESFEGMTPEKLMELIKKHNIRCSKCKGYFKSIEELNMMFPISVGVGRGMKRAYLSPETAQGAYLNFKLEFEAVRKKLPLGLAIIGKAFRNEISPRNALIRMREFTQAELQIFFDPDDIYEHPRFDDVAKYKLRLATLKGDVMELSCNDAIKKLELPKFYVYYLAKVQEFYLNILKLPKNRFRLRKLSEDEKAFYNKYHLDVELKFDDIGWKEVAGIHYRTNHDLKGHQKFSKERLEVNINGKRFIPHVLEISFGIDRNIYALLDLCYYKDGERTVLRFPRILTPFDTAVFPLVDRNGLTEKAIKIKKLLKNSGFVVFFDVSGSIGRRYRRMDEIGVISAITIDYQTLKDDTVTLRDRDTMKQIRIGIKELPEVLKRFINGEKLEKLGDSIISKNL